MRGLLGRRSLPGGEGILLEPAASIHTFFMRFPIDVVFLDKERVVVGIARGTPTLAGGLPERRPCRARARERRERPPSASDRRPARSSMIAPFVVWLALAPCTITGTPGNDFLLGTKGNDVICGLGGNDLIDGLEGRDVVWAGPGADRIQAGPGYDTVYGGTGNDTMWAWDGAPDKLDGGPGTDRAWFDGRDSVRSIERRS